MAAIFRFRRLWIWSLLAIVAWVIIDLYYPFKRDIRKIDATEMAAMETHMWRSYYEKKYIRLFLQTATLMRDEFHFPFWRSQRAAYCAAKAAFVFKDGKSR